MARICGFVMGVTAEELTRRQVPVIQSGISSDFPLEFQPPCAVTCGQRTSAEGCDSQVTEGRAPALGPRGPCHSTCVVTSCLGVPAAFSSLGPQALGMTQLAQ